MTLPQKRIVLLLQTDNGMSVITLIGIYVLFLVWLT